MQIQYRESLKFGLILFLVLKSLLILIILIQNHYRERIDFANSINTILLKENMTDNEKIIILMNYSYYHIPGACTQKSNGFELLAKNAGLKTEHIVLVGDTGSHALSRVKLNNVWIYIDSYNNKYAHSLKDISFNYTTAYRHINCYYGDCHNYNDFIKAFYKIFYVKRIQ